MTNTIAEPDLCRSQPHARILAELEQARARSEQSVPREVLPEIIPDHSAAEIALALEQLAAASLIDQVFDRDFKLYRVTLRTKR